jgi:hypothetical protein
VKKYGGVKTLFLVEEKFFFKNMEGMVSFYISVVNINVTVPQAEIIVVLRNSNVFVWVSVASTGISC